MALEHFLVSLIPYITSTLELVGVLIITLGSVKAFWEFVRTGFNFDNENLKLDLAKALALSLEFKLGSEILKTVIIRTLDEFIILAAVVFLRVIMTFVIHWEIKSSQNEKRLDILYKREEKIEEGCDVDSIDPPRPEDVNTEVQ